MNQLYEYKFIRLGHGLLWPKQEAENYKAVIEQYSREGWRLVQVFAPSRTMLGIANFHEIILERRK